MTGITRDELMQMARGCDHLWDDSGADDVDNAAWLIAFTNTILERAAAEVDNHGQDLCHGDKDMQKYRERSKSTREMYSGAIRALKINTGD